MDDKDPSTRSGRGRPRIGRQTTVTLRPDQDNEVGRIARATGRPRAHVIRELIDMALGR